jgi:hypothetical protein
MTAYKIYHGSAKLPPPSDRLLEQIAAHFYESLRDAGMMRARGDAPANWSALRRSYPDVADSWVAAAKQSYGAIARAGGGGVERIRETSGG